MRSLSDMGLKYYVMVEPQELELYRRLSPKPSDATYLSLETGNHGQGPDLARNACWDYAKANLKAKRFFVLDDNLRVSDTAVFFGTAVVSGNTTIN